MSGKSALARCLRISEGILGVVGFRVSGAMVLLYHRVAEHYTDPMNLCVGKQHFDEHMLHLRRHYIPLSLVELELALRIGKVPPRSVAVTFDDGYADNVWNAMPILERHNVPATIFVVTGYVNGDQELYHDELHRVFLEPVTLPKFFKMTLNSQEYCWQLEEFVSQSHAKSLQAGYYFPLRQRCYRDLHRLMRQLDHSKKVWVLNHLWKWANIARPPRSERRIVNVNELLRIGHSKLVSVGCHSSSHLWLADHLETTQREEIVGSKAELEMVLGRTVNHFSYPYGSPDAVSAKVVEIVREAGFTAAWMNVPALTTSRADRYLLPRFVVRDWPGEEFAKRLRCSFAF